MTQPFEVCILDLAQAGHMTRNEMLRLQVGMVILARVADKLQGRDPYCHESYRKANSLLDLLGQEWREAQNHVIDAMTGEKRMEAHA